MAVRLTWTNNSSAHDGTYVYRSTATMDPQALPAPIADLPAGSEEYADGGATQQVVYYYRVQDHEGGQVSAVSDELIADFAPDYGSAQIGDYIGGGVYAGTIIYADARQFHIIFAIQAGAADGLQWGNSGTTTGATDPDDGKANQDLILASFDNGDSGAFYHCRDYIDSEGNDDYYVPSKNEIALFDALADMLHPEFATDRIDFRWSSTESSSTQAWVRQLSNGTEGTSNKTATNRWVRPIRRVAV